MAGISEKPKGTGKVSGEAKKLLQELEERRRLRPWRFYRSVPAIAKFHESLAPIRVLAGPNRGGKTTAGCAELLCYATGFNPVRNERYATPNLTWAVALDYGNLGHVMRQKIFSMLPPGYKFFKQESIIRLPKPWGSEIHLKSADSGREKFQGAGLLAAWFDEEPKGLAGEEIFGEVYARRAPGVPLRIFMTFTPLQGLSWSYRRLWNPESTERYPGVETFYFDLHDCSKALGGFLTDGEIETIEQGYPEWEREARVHGRYMHIGGHCYFDYPLLQKAELKGEPGKTYKISFAPPNRATLSEDPAGPLVVYRPPAPGRKYICGVDTAAGIGRDFSVASVWDREDLALCAQWRSNRVDPDLFGSEGVLPLGYHYNTALLVVETNGEHGGTVVSQLKGRYPNIWLRMEWDKAKGGYTKSYGFRTDSRTRGRLFDAVKRALREDEWNPSKELVQEMKGIIGDVDGRPDHLEGTHDDQVVAAGLALCVNYESPAVKLPPWHRMKTAVSGPRELQWMGT